MKTRCGFRGWVTTDYTRQGGPARHALRQSTSRLLPLRRARDEETSPFCLRRAWSGAPAPLAPAQPPDCPVLPPVSGTLRGPVSLCRVSFGARHWHTRSTSARHRIRHGIRHAVARTGRRLCPYVANGRLRHRRIGDSGRSGRLGVPQLRPAVRARPARRGGPCGSRPRAR